MRINSDILTPLSEAEEQKRLVDELCTEETYYFIARVYGELCAQYGYPNYRLIPWSNHTSPAYKKRINEIRKLIEVTVELGVPFLVYMRAQFEQQLPFLKRYGLEYVPLRRMTSERGRTSFQHWQRKIDAKYVLRQDKAQYFNATQLNVRRSLEESMTMLAERLPHLLAITDVEVIAELDALARLGRVSNIYVFTSRFGGATPFLAGLTRAVSKKLLDRNTLETIRRTKDELLPLFSATVREYL